jgi:hypothetical protein
VPHASYRAPSMAAPCNFESVCILVMLEWIGAVVVDLNRNEDVWAVTRRRVIVNSLDAVGRMQL